MTQNVGSYDRVIRIALAATVAAGLLTLGQNFSGAEMLACLLIPLVLLLTGAVGYCPLYGLLGISTHRPWPR